MGIEYTNLLSRGGLRLPTNSLATCVCRSFAKIDLAKERLLLPPKHARKAAEMVLRRDSGIQNFMCEEHFHWGMTEVNKTVTNVYFNNKQAITNDNVRKDDVVAFKSRRNKRLFNNEDCKYLVKIVLLFFSFLALN